LGLVPLAEILPASFPIQITTLNGRTYNFDAREILAENATRDLCAEIDHKFLTTVDKIITMRNILNEGNHAGYDWRVVHNGMGYRCGYVKVFEGHPWFKKHYDDIKANAHGGLTYSDDSEDGGWWVGFDCAHHMDAPDPSLDVEDRMMASIWSLGLGGTVRSQEYVENECKCLCEQAAECPTLSTPRV
jgi:hypothetical protein